jgi:legumain
MHAADINKAIETLHSRGGYKEFLFYLEACESGSIFNGLLKAPDAKAVTAANPKESSWGWYCPGSATGGDKVDGKEIGSCLGDEFSVRWMEDTDANDISTETVGQQFSKVLKAVTKSHVQQYGATSLDSEPIGDFQGTDGQKSLKTATTTIEGNGVDSRQAELHQAYYMVERAKTAVARKAAEQDLAALLARRHSADRTFSAIASAACQAGSCSVEEMLEGPVEAVTKVSCHRGALEAVVNHCGAFNDYSLRYSRLFANLCENGIAEQAIVTAIEKACDATVVV